MPYFATNAGQVQSADPDSTLRGVPSETREQGHKVQFWVRSPPDCLPTLLYSRINHYRIMHDLQPYFDA